MLAPLLVAVVYNDGDAQAFVKSCVVSGALGAALFVAFRGGPVEVGHREGFVIVALSWISTVLVSSLPFVFSGVFPSFVDSLFETTSGITTTGASVVSHIEGLPHGILFWRSMTHWLGGIGIVVLSLAVLPLLGIGGMQLYKSEASVVSAEKFAPRVKEMARIIVIVYLVLSFALLVFLVMAGMGIFDAFIHTFGTIATGGYSDKNISVEYFNNPHIEAVIIVFMVVGATNFSLHYRFFHEGYRVYTRDDEFRFYVTVMAVATLVVTFDIAGARFEGFFTALRHGLFQVVSIMTTTGYSTDDFGSWPFLSQMVLFSLMFFGGSAGSTTGAIKCIRLVLLVKIGYREIYRLIHPHAVAPVKLGGKVIPPEVVSAVMGFTFLYITVFMVTSLLLTALGLDILTAISSSAATLGNIGPGLAAAGPASNYAAVPEPGKWLLIFNMLLGRLELYTLLVLLAPAFWRG
ncbi:MAG TPA: TrkH family potassium uptake protein [Deltaproteobacteria bacterium]|nr:TrkH family potassium uptake protein [Deltaproteobacteria bacterium]